MAIWWRCRRWPARSIPIRWARGPAGGSSSCRHRQRRPPVRQGTLGAQASGRVTEVLVRNGDAVRAGQPLVRLEPATRSTTRTPPARRRPARPRALASAQADYERARQLREKEYISLAALQRAEAGLRSTEAEARATAAQASAARTRAGWRTVSAPYAGRVMDLMVTPGDLATPGRPLVALYDPAALRVIAQVPESLAARLRTDAPAQVLPRTPAGAAAGASGALAVASWRVVPASIHRATAREVPRGYRTGAMLQPGQFAVLRLQLAGDAQHAASHRRGLSGRSEVTAVYGGG
ncbi:MAG: efflux RND transporter periplasmic adaptor subunit [Steroidobacteraceae bacterium]